MSSRYFLEVQKGRRKLRFVIWDNDTGEIVKEETIELKGTEVDIAPTLNAYKHLTQTLNQE